jgi:hypothetical protein
MHKVRQEMPGQGTLWEPDYDTPTFGHVSRGTAEQFIMPLEWQKNLGRFSFGFGIWYGPLLASVVVFGEPSAKELAEGVCGKENAHKVLELTRGATLPDMPHNTGSRLIGWALRWLYKNTDKRIVVAYVDPRAGEVGALYQACNFLYTGLSEPRTDWTWPTMPETTTTRSLSKDLKTKAGLDRLGIEAVSTPRPRKHRYALIIGSPTDRRVLRRALKYPVLDPPKRGQ